MVVVDIQQNIHHQLPFVLDQDQVLCSRLEVPQQHPCPKIQLYWVEVFSGTNLWVPLSYQGGASLWVLSGTNL